MKLEVGMYVRTQNNGIAKIKSFHSNIYDDYICISHYFDLVRKKEITKASHNIIDLIEEGDYVNGMEVLDADWINEDGDYEEGLAFPMYASDDLDVIENWQPLKYTKIKTIVTKEQFESMSYKVED